MNQRDALERMYRLMETAIQLLSAAEAAVFASGITATVEGQDVWEREVKKLKNDYVRLLGTIEDMVPGEAPPDKCAVCGVAVLNVSKHAEWHKEQQGTDWAAFAREQMKNIPYSFSGTSRYHLDAGMWNCAACNSINTPDEDACTNCKQARYYETDGVKSTPIKSLRLHPSDVAIDIVHMPDCACVGDDAETTRVIDPLCIQGYIISARAVAGIKDVKGNN